MVQLWSYVGNPGFGIHCHPLDSVNPGFTWRAPLISPLYSSGLTYRDSENRPTRLQIQDCLLRCADCPRRVMVHICCAGQEVARDLQPVGVDINEPINEEGGHLVKETDSRGRTVAEG